MSLICRFYCDQPLGRKPFQLNRGNPKWSQTWRANYANSYMYCDTFWLQLCNHLAHVIVFWQIKWKNLYVTVPLLLCFTLNLRAIFQVQDPKFNWKILSKSLRHVSLQGHEETLGLSFYPDWSTTKQKVYVTEIVWRLGFADIIFQLESGDVPKYVCVCRL